MILRSTIYLVLSALFFMGCSSSNDPLTVAGGVPGQGTLDSDWLLPTNAVFDGGPGKDGIPAVDAPVFSSAEEIQFMDEGDLIIGIREGEEIKGYPHLIMDWHEIVNDRVGDESVAITYCPLTGTAIGWDRFIGGQETTFGVSGLLYNNNLIPFDRATDSNWSQMLLKSVNGDLIGQGVETYSLLETTWATWKKMFPGSKVMNLNTGFSRQYGVYPYGDYRTNNDFLLFPLTQDDTRFPRKERGMGVIVDEVARYYRFQDFSNQRIVLKEDRINGIDLLIVGSSSENFLVAFEIPLRSEIVSFEAIQEGGQVVFQDNIGNEYDVFGYVIRGPNAGFRLGQPPHFIGYWFSWGAFYPDVTVYQ